MIDLIGVDRRHRPDRREPRRPAHRAAPGHPPRHRLGPHRGDHRHHQHDRGRRRWPKPRTSSSTARCPATATATAATARSAPTTPARAARRWRPRSRRDRPSGRTRFLSGQAEAIRLGTLYALGHGAVVIALGLAALAFGALLPDWLDPIMGRIVGLTLLALGLWVMYSIYRYARAGEAFRLRSRWMLVFDGDPLRLAPVPGAAPRPRARRAARDELLRRAHLVRRRDDPRRRRRDRDARSC